MSGNGGDDVTGAKVGGLGRCTGINFGDRDSPGIIREGHSLPEIVGEGGGDEAGAGAAVHGPNRLLAFPFTHSSRNFQFLTEAVHSEYGRFIRSFIADSVDQPVGILKRFAVKGQNEVSGAKAAVSAGEPSNT